MSRNIKQKYLLISLATSVCYLSGMAILSRLQGLPWDTAPAFWVGIVGFPYWVKVLSAITILAGTASIYFIPGVFVAKHFSRSDESLIEVFLKGFLLNYFFYYFLSTLYKAISGQEFSRGPFLILMGAGILITGLLFLFTAPKAEARGKNLTGKVASNKGFLVFYVIFLACIFYAFREKIFLAHFDGDGAEQYWLAHSVKSGILPTGYRSLITLIPQFVFAPSIYLNAFALTLFGRAEFIIKIEILVAFIWIGFVLRGLIGEFRGDKKFGIKESAPLFLYLLTFFCIIAFRAGYWSPTDLAKSNETLLLAFFLSGFYLLSKPEKNNDILAAIFFVLAAMIRYNGFFMITFFLTVFSILFKRYKCFLWYLAGVVLAVLALDLLLIPSAFKFKDMLLELLSDADGLRAEKFSFQFMLAYLKNYFIFTAGLSVFLILNLKNRYVLLMSLTTLFFLIGPSWSDCLPAHFFVPIIMFPLLSYYLLRMADQKAVSGMVVICGLLSLCYVLPKTGSPRAVFFENVWSRFCANSNNLFEVVPRFFKIRRALYLMDDRVSMYYADLMPKPNKKYLMYLETLPPQMSEQYELVIKNNQKIYLLKGLSWDQFIEENSFALEEYLRGDFPHLVRRKEVDSYAEFSGSFSRNHGEK